MVAFSAKETEDALDKNDNPLLKKSFIALNKLGHKYLPGFRRCGFKFSLLWDAQS